MSKDPSNEAGPCAEFQGGSAAATGGVGDGADGHDNDNSDNVFDMAVDEEDDEDDDDSVADRQQFATDTFAGLLAPPDSRDEELKSRRKRNLITGVMDELRRLRDKARQLTNTRLKLLRTTKKRRSLLGHNGQDSGWSLSNGLEQRW